MAKLVTPLSDARIRAFKAAVKPYDTADGSGLFIRTLPSGAKRWVFRYKRPVLKAVNNWVIGEYPAMTLADARDRRTEFRSQLANGIDPREHETKTLPALRTTFADLGDMWLAHKQPTLSRHFYRDTVSALNNHVYPVIGALPVETIKTHYGIAVLDKLVADANERLMLDGKPLEADTIVVATGPWMSEMYPRTVKPITHVVGINVFYTSTPEGSTDFDAERMPCWIDHGQSAFGIPSVEGHGVKAAAVIPEHIDINDDDRLIDKNLIPRTQSYIRTRFPGLVGQKVVDSKFNQIIMTPDTHFILDWHPEHRNVLLAGGMFGAPFQTRTSMGRVRRRSCSQRLRYRRPF